jgi:hypothetical protein
MDISRIPGLPTRSDAIPGMLSDVIPAKFPIPPGLLLDCVPTTLTKGELPCSLALHVPETYAPLVTAQFGAPGVVSVAAFNRRTFSPSPSAVPTP